MSNILLVMAILNKELQMNYFILFVWSKSTNL